MSSAIFSSASAPASVSVSVSASLYPSLSPPSVSSLLIRGPDDFHVHLRDGAFLPSTVPFTFSVFSRCLIMPNLIPPVRTVSDAHEYRERILSHIPSSARDRANPLMAIYLTHKTSVEEIIEAAQSAIVFAVKLYPAGATTHSQFGVNLSRLEEFDAVFRVIEDSGLILCIHGEVADESCDVFDREAQFIEQHAKKLVAKFPKLKIILEHISTSEGVNFVLSASEFVAATLTAHHLALNRNALFEGGLRPHYYCAPILKSESHRQSLVAAATSGNPKFFAGTDSAPHPITSKQNSCCAAGCFSSPVAIQKYAEIFESEGKLDRLENFTSVFGAQFYGIPLNPHFIKLDRIEQLVPTMIDSPAGTLVPFEAGKFLKWRIQTITAEVESKLESKSIAESSAAHVKQSALVNIEPTNSAARDLRTNEE